ncbi:MAG: exodeoxyribonuclease VII small subunit [Pseudomonadota bacterium]
MNTSSSNIPATFEAALTELEQIVRNLESGKTSLEDSIAAYTRGMELKAFCETRLKEAQLKVDQIAQATDGTLTTSSFSQ